MLTGRPTEPSRQPDRGSVLILMPAAVLIVLLLGAIAVDLTVVHLRQRAAVSAAASAANDAVTYGLDQSALRRGQGYHLDPNLVSPPEISQTTPDTITVVLHVRARYLFARALPHGPTESIVTATASATVDHR
jgi:hypothetical protein